MKPNRTSRLRSIVETLALRNGPAAAAVRLLVLLAAGCVLAPGAASASPHTHSGDVFAISDVRVDEEAETAAAARETAISTAHHIAFGRLVRRLVLRTQWPRLPSPDAARIAPLVESFTIDSEKTSDIRYLAAMTFRFRRQEVRRLLRSRGIEFAETAARPVLVLPILDNAGALTLWERPNPWFDAWKALPPSDGLFPILLPDGSLADIRDLGAGQVVAGDRQPMAALAARYRAVSVLAAVARFRADLRSGRRGLEVTLRRFGGGETEQPRIVSLTRGQDEGSDTVIARAAREVAERLEEDWKRRTLLRFARRDEIIARMPLARLADWITVRRTLGSVAMLRDMQLVAISRRAAAVRLGFYGTVEQFRLALAQHGIILAGKAGSWTLTTAPSRFSGGGRQQ